MQIETRKVSMRRRKELEIAKLELKLEEKELELYTDIAILNAKSGEAYRVVSSFSHMIGEKSLQSSNGTT